MEETISLRELMETLRKRIRLIILVTLVAVVMSGAVSYFVITPTYQSSTQLLVNQAKTDQPMYNPAEIQTNLQLINTYNVIIKSPAILEPVIKELNLNMSASQLDNKITVQSERESQVVNVTVQDPDPHQAAKIANTVATVFKKEIVDIMNGDNVSILAKAEVGENAAPVKPQPLLNIAIALVVGLMAGVGIAFLLEYLDQTVKTEQDVEQLLGIPILGVVAPVENELEKRGKRGLKTRHRGEVVDS